MELVVDANILLAAPESLLIETAKHLSKAASLRRRIGLSEPEVQDLYGLLTTSVESYPKASYRRCMSEALEIAPHPEDAPYLALALHMDIPIWSNDKGMKTQKKIRIFSTHELLSELRRS